MSKISSLLHANSTTITKYLEPNQWVSLNDVQGVIIVMEGQIDIFTQITQSNGECYKNFIGQLNVHDGACGVKIDHSVSFQLKAKEQSQILMLSFSALNEMKENQAYVQGLKRWFSLVTQLLPNDTPNTQAENITVNNQYTFQKDQVISSDKDLVWLIKNSDPMKVEVSNKVHNVKYPFPMVFNQLLKSKSEFQCKTISIEELIAKRSIRRATKQIYQMVFDHVQSSHEKKCQSIKQTYSHIKRHKKEMVQESIRELSSDSRLKSPSPSKPTLESVGYICQQMAKYYGYKTELSKTYDDLEPFFRDNNIPFRQIRLSDDWVNDNIEGFIGYHQPTKKYAFIFPKGRLFMRETEDGKTRFISKKESKEFDVKAIQILPKSGKKEFKLSMGSLIQLHGINLPQFLVMSFITSLMAIIPPLTAHAVIDSILISTNILNITVLISSGLAVSLGLAIIMMVKNQRIQSYTHQTDYRFTARFFHSILKEKTFDQLRKVSIGQLLNSLNQIKAIKEGSNVAAMQIAPFLYLAVCSLTVTGIYSWGVALWIAGCTIAIASCGYGLARRSHQTFKNASRINEQLRDFSIEMMQGMEKIKSMGAEHQFFKRWTSLFSKKMTLKANSDTPYFWTSVCIDSILPVGVLATIFALSVSNITPSAGQIVATFTSSVIFLQTISIALHKWTECEKTQQNKSIETPDLTSASTSKKRYEFMGGLSIHNCQFSYIQGKPIIQAFNLSIQTGKTIACIGKSGSGKSSLIRMIMGFERPEKGTIYYDNIAHNKVDFEGLRKQIGVVLQDSECVPGDIYTNITSGAYIAETKLWRILKIVHLDEEIRQMPMGLHTIISQENGALSASQKQRIMLARAILNEPKMLIIDESMHAIEESMHERILLEINRLPMTKLIVSHRPKTIRHADHIIVIDNGTIVESGSYEGLMQEHGLFYDLIRHH